MDPLSDILALMEPKSCIARGFGFRGDLAIHWPRHTGVKCYALLSGGCWLTVEGVSEPMRLSPGDCFLLPHGLPFTLTTDLSLTPIDFHDLVAQGGVEGFTREQLPGYNYIAGGFFALDGEHAGLLLSALPHIVHIRSDADRAAMRWALERMREELACPQPGSTLIAQQIAYTMLIQAIRLHLLDAARGQTGWLFALADRHMGAAISCMHDRPGDPWTLEALAGQVGMSRSVFAERFRFTVGTTPMEYLTRWRMLLASERLRNSDESVSTIASSLGYGSESAFGKAFRKVMGTSPKRYSRQPQPGAALPAPAEPAHG